MKKIILWSICFLLLTALIPFCVGVTSVKNANSNPVNSYLSKSSNITSATEVTKNIELSEEELNSICCMTMKYVKDDTDNQAKLAILSLCANNYLCLKRENNALPDMQISTYSDELLADLRNILSKGLVEFSYKGNMVYIPLVNISPGYTVTSDEYPYIQEVASPWDTLEEGYNTKNQNECGISITGIEYLCRNSSTAEEATAWYLPDFEIKYIEFI